MTSSGRIFLVTGATDGIGKHTATKLAQTGATVLLHGRDKAKLEQAAQEIKEKTNNSNLATFLADFSSLAEVRKLSEAIHQKFDHLDVLINNAGVLLNTRQESADGFEMTFAVNVLAPFLLSSLLLDLLKKGSDSRIVNVASMLQADTIDFNDLQLKTSYDGKHAYKLSKVCVIMFTYDMAEMLKANDIAAISFHPGLVNTKLLEAWGGVEGIDVNTADDEFILTTDAKLNGVTGKYFLDCKDSESNALSYDENARKRLWDTLVDITGADFKC